MSVTRPENPTRYTPTQVHFVAFYVLHRDCSFYGVKQIDKPGKPSIVAYSFLRQEDNQIFHYFQVVQDASQSQNLYPVLEDWLDCYQELLEKKIIDVHDVVFAPLVQVQKGRAHFNTILLYSDFAYLIEPRGNNRMGLTSSYPIDGLLNILHDRLGKEKKALQLLVKRQSFFDDTTCGAHHLNFIESIMHLHVKHIINPQELKKYLKETHLSRRSGDGEKIEYISQEISHFAKVVKPQTQKKLNASAVALLPEEEDFCALSDKDGTPFIFQQKDFHFQLAIFFQAKRDYKHQAILEIAQDEIKKNYFDLSEAEKSKNPLNRYMTATFIISALSKIVQCQSHAVICRAVNFLYICYLSIQEKNSRLKVALGYALAVLLDCKEEYIKHLAETIDLFKERIGLMGWQIISDNTFSPNNFAKLLEMMRRLNVLDTKTVLQKVNIFSENNKDIQHALHCEIFEFIDSLLNENLRVFQNK